METITMIAVLLGILLLVLLITTIKLVKTNSKNKHDLLRFQTITDVEKERDTILAKADADRTLILKSISELEAKYQEAYTKYKSLIKEIGNVEDTAVLAEMGIYKPHFDYKTPDEYKIKLEEIFEKQKQMIKSDSAVTCSTQWTVGDSRREGKKMSDRNRKLALRAFNGECDAIISKVKWDNVDKMEERIKRSFEKINELNSVLTIQISTEYLSLKLQELWGEYELVDAEYKEKEERKAIAEKLREEEKSLKEIERIAKESEEEEKRYAYALEKAKRELSNSMGVEAEKLNSKIKELESELEQAHKQKERAISRAEQTKSGYVYFLSNIGSFGKNIFKIGLTRRFEPMDRVRELSGASVPFEFDVHALMFSENAPDLESKLHSYFKNRKVNLVNDRKEFFHVSAEEIVDWAKKEGIRLAFSSEPEARTYKETLAIREKTKKEKTATESKIDDKIKFSKTLFS